jgi:hypothetical protein
VLALLVSHRLTRTDGAPGAPLAETPAAICWPYMDGITAQSFVI